MAAKARAFDPLGRVRGRLPSRAERVCAITFDDDPSAQTARVVDILARQQIKATFFVLADLPGILDRLRADGFTFLTLDRA